MKATGEVIQVCDECDSLWSVGTVPNTTEYDIVEEFLMDRGLSPLWDEIEKVDRP